MNAQYCWVCQRSHPFLAHKKNAIRIAESSLLNSKPCDAPASKQAVVSQSNKRRRRLEDELLLDGSDSDSIQSESSLESSSSEEEDEAGSSEPKVRKSHDNWRQSSQSGADLKDMNPMLL